MLQRALLHCSVALILELSPPSLPSSLLTSIAYVCAPSFCVCAQAARVKVQEADALAKRYWAVSSSARAASA